MPRPVPRPDVASGPPLILGVSACLLGRAVRYDGSHKLDRWITEELGRFARFVPVCPEVEAGLGVPREPMRLTGDPAAPRLVTIHTGRDLTDRLQRWAEARIRELAEAQVRGFIFKSRSPSSGLARVQVSPLGGGAPVPAGIGIFARVFVERFPLLPVTDEECLADPLARQRFISRLGVPLRAG